MKEFSGYTCGMGIGGWLTNYKRVALLPPEKRKVITQGDIEHFETYITREDVKRIAGFGMDHIRVCFDQIVIEDNDHPFTYRESGFEHIDHFIEWCQLEKINVILNLHKAVGAYCDCHEPRQLLDEPEYQERFIKMWEAFEDRYHGLDIPFEILNEISTSDSEKWNQLATRTIDAIRAKNPTRKIIIGSVLWNKPYKLAELKIFDDENVIYTFHHYDPDEFTHQRGLLRENYHFCNREVPYPYSAQRYIDVRREAGIDASIYNGVEVVDKKFTERLLRGAIDFAAAHPDKILTCGEFGTIRHCPLEYRINWFRDVISILREHGIAYTVWNYLSTPYDGNRFSLVDDDRREILSPALLDAICGR